MSYWTPYAYLREVRSAQRQQQSAAGNNVRVTGVRSVNARMYTTLSTPLTSRFEPNYTSRVVTPVSLLSRFERAAMPLVRTRSFYPLTRAGIIPPPALPRREEDRWIFTHRIEPMSFAAPAGQPPPPPPPAKIQPAAEVQSPEERAAEKAAQEAMQIASDAAQTAAAQAMLVTNATTRARAAAQRATNLLSRMRTVSPERAQRFVSGIRNAATEAANAAQEAIQALHLIQTATQQAQAAAVTTTNLYATYSTQVIDSAVTSSAIFATTATAHLNGATSLQQEAASLYADTAAIFRNAQTVIDQAIAQDAERSASTAQARVDELSQSITRMENNVQILVTVALSLESRVYHLARRVLTAPTAIEARDAANQARAIANQIRDYTWQASEFLTSAQSLESDAANSLSIVIRANARASSELTQNALTATSQAVQAMQSSSANIQAQLQRAKAVESSTESAAELAEENAQSREEQEALFPPRDRRDPPPPPPGAAAARVRVHFGGRQTEEFDENAPTGTMAVPLKSAPEKSIFKHPKTSEAQQQRALFRMEEMKMEATLQAQIDERFVWEEQKHGEAEAKSKTEDED